MDPIVRPRGRRSQREHFYRRRSQSERFSRERSQSERFCRGRSLCERFYRGRSLCERFYRGRSQSERSHFYEPWAAYCEDDVARSDARLLVVARRVAGELEDLDRHGLKDRGEVDRRADADARRVLAKLHVAEDAAHRELQA